ncbi:MAG: PadR family transcriptional regulator [Oscillospiraceae bacterium]
MGRSVSELIHSYVPMSEPSFLSLLCLVEPKHGYGIMQKVLEQSGGRVSLGASTVYTILYKMEQDGLIRVASEVDRRKVYQITSAGYEVLEAETARLGELARFANAVLSRNPGPVKALCGATERSV